MLSLTLLMITSAFKALWEKRWDYLTFFLLQSPRHILRDCNNRLWLKFFQATGTIRKYKDDAHHGHKRSITVKFSWDLKRDVNTNQLLLQELCLGPFCFLFSMINMCCIWCISATVYIFKNLPENRLQSITPVCSYAYQFLLPVCEDLGQRES